MVYKEINKKLLEKREKKWNATHKIIKGIDHKVCKICNEWLPSNKEFFYKNKTNSVDGLHTYCKKCSNKKSMQWELNNIESTRKRQKEYRETYKERKSELMKKWFSSNKDYYQSYQKRWRQENKDKLKKYNKYRSMNKKHKISEDEWYSCKEYFEHKCAYCGLHIDDHFVTWNDELKKMDLHKEHVDHEGANDLSNCVPACKNCNSQKWEFTLNDWYIIENPCYSKERHEKISLWLEKDYKRFIKEL